jgi:hypothetical protein
VSQKNPKGRHAKREDDPEAGRRNFNERRDAARQQRIQAKGQANPKLMKGR